MRSLPDTLLMHVMISFLLYGWISFLCALLGIFHITTIGSIWLLTVISLWYTLRQKNALPQKKQQETVTKQKWIMLLITLAASIFVVITSEPTIYTGRDQGSISDAAFSLVRDHGLYATRGDQASISQPFFDIYGPGKALNFPGFHYSNFGTLVTQFPVPYISYISGLLALIGITGINIANGLCLFLFLTGICFGTIRFFNQTHHGFVILAIILTAFTPLWFARTTLSENLAGALFACIFYAVSVLITTKSQEHRTKELLIIIAGLGSTLLFFTRIEGIWILASLSIIIALHKPLQKSLATFVNQNRPTRIVLPLSIFIATLCLALVMSTAFYKTVLGAFFTPFLALFFASESNAPTAESVQNIATQTAIQKLLDVLLPIYTSYGLLTLCVGGCIAAISIISHSKTNKRRSGHTITSLAFPLILAGPLFLYFIDPQISSDHPWMLRRFTWIILPVLGIYCTLLTKWEKNLTAKNIFAWTFVGCICLHGLWASKGLIAYAENRGLSAQVETFATQFEPEDLILLPPHVTGDNWSMIDAALRNMHKKSAVYFYNPDDYAKLDLTQFKKIYLLVPYANDIPRDSQITPPDYTTILQETDAQQRGTVTFSTSRLPYTGNKNMPFMSPEPETVSITNTIYQLR